MSASTTEVVDEVSKWGVGLGTLGVALAPLSIPFLILTAVALVPLLLPLLAAGLLFAVLATPVLLIRGAVRRIRGGVSSPGAAPPERAPGASGRPAWR